MGGATKDALGAMLKVIPKQHIFAQVVGKVTQEQLQGDYY